MIRVFEPHLTTRDKISVLKTLFQKNISGTSPVVKDFEEITANKFNRKYSVSVSNGSVALDIALQSLDLKEGDEVILPSHTIISCLSAVIRTKGTPVFCDVDEKTWNMTLSEVKRHVTNNTKAILMVHIFGLPSEATEIEQFCKEKGIYLIEDAAEAHGQKQMNKLCGSFGDISTFSFYANKHITTGEGGMVLTNSKETYKKLIQMRNLDFTNERFKHENFYWNYRLSGLQASLGISQLRNLENVIKNKRMQGKIYQDLLLEHSDIIQPPLDSFSDVNNHYWVFGILLKKKNIRNELMEKMYKDGIETRPFFWPLHLQSALSDNLKKEKGYLPVSENLGENGLYLPMGNHLNKKIQKNIISMLIKNIKTF